MTWKSYLRTRTRQPEFLWRMVIWMLAVGIGAGYVAEKIWHSKQADAVEVAPLNEPLRQVKTHAREGEWWQVVWGLPEVIYSRFARPGPLALAAIACACWLVFLWQALNTPPPSSLCFWCLPIAIALGVLSIWPTHFMSLWQEHAWNLRESEELIPGVRFFVLGVGFREEFAKLLCVLPLMPLLLRIRSELAALLLSGCVGLGFAFAENIGYFARSGGADSMGRFLTANPMHISLTGVAGLMLYRTFRNPSGWAAYALGVFGVLVFAHGLYDAFIVVPALAEYGLLGTIIFALIVYQFFRELRDLRKRGGETISLSATFLFGVSLLLAATFVYLSATSGMSVAFDSLTSSVLGLAVMVYLFLREMPESMVTV